MYPDLFCGVPSRLMLDRLTFFVAERENIRQQKAECYPPPWTEDLVLQNYRFCNVRRKHDRVSAWIIQNVIDRYHNHPRLWFMLCCARWINWPPTIQALIDEGAWPVNGFDAEAFGAVVDRIADSGKKAWTGAYMITARQIEPGMKKGQFIARRMLNEAYESKALRDYFETSRPRTVEGAIAAFDGVNGFGTFMAGQAVADMTYSNILSDASDLKTYAPIGPGSTRGLNLLFDRPINDRIPQDQFNQELIYTLGEVNERLGGALDDLTLHDWQNCFCEFGKYVRAFTGAGRPRTMYKPETAF